MVFLFPAHTLLSPDTRLSSRSPPPPLLSPALRLPPLPGTTVLGPPSHDFKPKGKELVTFHPPAAPLTDHTGHMELAQSILFFDRELHRRGSPESEGDCSWERQRFTRKGTGRDTSFLRAAMFNRGGMSPLPLIFEPRRGVWEKTGTKEKHPKLTLTIPFPRSHSLPLMPLDLLSLTYCSDSRLGSLRSHSLFPSQTRSSPSLNKPTTN